MEYIIYKIGPHVQKVLQCKGGEYYVMDMRDVKERWDDIFKRGIVHEISLSSWEDWGIFREQIQNFQE